MTYIPKTQTIYSNYRIEVALQDPWYYNENYKTPEEKHLSMTRDLEDLCVAANRHLEAHDGISSHYDREVCCQFCGESWDDATDDEGVPGCCHEAVSDYETQTEVIDSKGEEIA